MYGDLSRANRVAVLVPGMGNDLTTFDARVGLPAANLQLRAGRSSAGRHVATIAWLGYDAPDALLSPQVVSASQARRGGRLLADAVSGLRLRDDVRVTLIGHSYGTTVIGAALQLGIRADNVLAMGSPGMFVEHASDFDRPHTRFFTMAAPGDHVTWLERFGTNPNEPGTGFTRLDSGGVGHSRYLLDGSLSQANALRVVADDDAHLTRRHRNPLEVAFGPLDKLRDWGDLSDRWVDDAQRRTHVPYVDRPLHAGIDVAQEVTAGPRRLLGRTVEMVEDRTGILTSAGHGALSKLVSVVEGQQPLTPPPDVASW